jgi:hypothetical protein
MSACPNLHFAFRSVPHHAVSRAAGPDGGYAQRPRAGRSGTDVEPLLPSFGSAAFLFAETAGGTTHSRATSSIAPAIRKSHPLDETSKEPIEI